MPTDDTTPLPPYEDTRLDPDLPYTTEAHRDIAVHAIEITVIANKLADLYPTTAKHLHGAAAVLESLADRDGL